MVFVAGRKEPLLTLRTVTQVHLFFLHTFPPFRSSFLSPLPYHTCSIYVINHFTLRSSFSFYTFRSLLLHAFHSWAFTRCLFCFSVLPFHSPSLFDRERPQCRRFCVSSRTFRRFESNKEPNNFADGAKICGNSAGSLCFVSAPKQFLLFLPPLLSLSVVLI